MSANGVMNRRSFLNGILKGGLFVWFAAFLAPVLSYVWPAQRRGPGTQSVSAGKPDDVPLWGAKTIAVAGSPVVVIRTPEGFKAYSAICTHLGCIVNWDAERRQIACPCHAGFFDVSGKPVSGPPPRPLPEHRVTVTDEEVMVMST